MVFWKKFQGRCFRSLLNAVSAPRELSPVGSKWLGGGWRRREQTDCFVQRVLSDGVAKCPVGFAGPLTCGTRFFHESFRAFAEDSASEELLASDMEIGHHVSSLNHSSQEKGGPLFPRTKPFFPTSSGPPNLNDDEEVHLVSPEAREIFETIWKDIEKHLTTDKAHIPKEILWLNGAPGSGKGANTPFILKTRGFEAAKAIQVSDLLQNSPESFEIMRHGGLVRDSLVLELLLESIFSLNGSKRYVDPDTEGEEVTGPVAGVVVDGFPRTTIQVDFVKLLYDKLMDIHYEYLNSPLEDNFPRPIFRMAILYVEEEESVRRQLARGKAAMIHNQRVRDSGVGELKEVRTTDLCEKSARKRYAVFREHYDTLLKLKAFFPFHLIDGMGTLSECRDQIEKELQYQSALELDASTFKSIAHIPLAKDIARHARSTMVSRLDNYAAHHQELFDQVIAIIDTDIVPILKTCALSGMAVYTTERSILIESTMACQMLADILSERGFYVNWQSRTREIPISIDPKTFIINTNKQTTLLFRINFDRPMIRSIDSPSMQQTLSRQSIPSPPIQSPEVNNHPESKESVISCIKCGDSHNCEC